MHFLYSPREYGDFEKAWYDESTGCTVRFPTYYPNGDYRFFIACDFSCGILGHPWRKELWVFGEKLIEEFRKKKNKLNISEL